MTDAEKRKLTELIEKARVRIHRPDTPSDALDRHFLKRLTIELEVAIATLAEKDAEIERLQEIIACDDNGKYLNDTKDNLADTIIGLRAALQAAEQKLAEGKK